MILESFILILYSFIEQQGNSDKNPLSFHWVHTKWALSLIYVTVHQFLKEKIRFINAELLPLPTNIE